MSAPVKSNRLAYVYSSGAMIVHYSKWAIGS